MRETIEQNERGIEVNQAQVESGDQQEGVLHVGILRRARVELVGRQGGALHAQVLQQEHLT